MDRDEVVADAMAVLLRLRQCNKGSTHWDGCEKDHVLCAAYRSIAALVERAESDKK